MSNFCSALQAMKLQASKIALMNALTFYTKGLEMNCKEPALDGLDKMCVLRCLKNESFGVIHGLV